MKHLNTVKKYLVPTGVGVLAVSVPAVAQVDTAAAVTEIGNITTAITAIGGAIIGVAAVAMAFRWVKAQFF